MTMKKLLLFFMLTSLVFLFSTARTIKKYNTKKVSTTLLKMQTYTNKVFGISFQYPSTWIQNNTNIYAINLSGDTTTIEIDFMDTLKNTNFSIVHYLAPRGVEIYKYAYEQLTSKEKSNSYEISQVIVANSKAIKISTTSIIDAKGNNLIEPISSINIKFLDKKKTGTFQLQFSTIKSNYKLEVDKLYKLLNTLIIQ